MFAIIGIHMIVCSLIYSVYCDICMDIQNRNDSIFLIGELSKKYLLMTRKYKILELRKYALTLNPPRLYMHRGRELGNIETVFPYFQNNSYFQQVKHILIGGRTMFVDDIDFIDLDVFDSSNQYRPIRFYFDYDNSHQQILNRTVLDTNQSMMISAYDTHQFYIFTYDTNISKPIMIPYEKNSRDYNPIDVRLSMILCYDHHSKHQIYSRYSDKNCQDSHEMLDFRRCFGFNSRGIIFIFCNYYVYTFPESIFWTLNQVKLFRNVSFSEFFTCDDIIHGADEGKFSVYKTLYIEL